jgi:Zn-dependent protease with chaperone function
VRGSAARVLRPLRGGFEGREAEGWLLYAATLTVEAALGATTRWLLVYFGAGVLSSVVAVGPSTRLTAACLFALAPFAFSIFGLLRPGVGAAWDRLGARPASTEERADLMAAMADLWLVDWQVTEPDEWYVLDNPLPIAAAQGGCVLVSTGLMKSRSLPAVIAHELGHVHSADSRLRTGPAWLVLWRRRVIRPTDWESSEPPLPLFAVVGIVLALAGGNAATMVLGSRWRAYREAREYAADAYAASLGQARTLIRFLTAFEQSPHAGVLRLLTALSDHPLPRARIARLHDYIVANYPIAPRPLWDQANRSSNAIRPRSSAAASRELAAPAAAGSCRTTVADPCPRSQRSSDATRTSAIAMPLAGGAASPAHRASQRASTALASLWHAARSR